MNKILKKVLFVFGILLVLPGLAFAQNLAQPPIQGFNLPVFITSTGGLLSLLQTVLNWIFFALVFVAIIMILLIAFNFVTKGGKDKDGAKDEWNKLTNILIGIGVALMAKGVVYLVCSLFTSQSCIFF